jgi:hypothetical protein
MDEIALAQDKIDNPLCDGCGERTWRGDLSDEHDGRFCPDCQELRAEDEAAARKEREVGA